MPTGPACSARSRATGAERVIVTHGYEAVMVRWLLQQGLQAEAFVTEYGDDAIEADAIATVATEEPAA